MKNELHVEMTWSFISGEYRLPMIHMHNHSMEETWKSLVEFSLATKFNIFGADQRWVHFLID